ncbi:MAG: hypothetical protein JST86_12020 [Bacteroidetes bacterium]|nr:hypothetical protein [Bacteroidota bacterium]
MRKHLLMLCSVLLMAACTATLHQKSETPEPIPEIAVSNPVLPADSLIHPLTDLDRTEDGGFILAPGYYETEFKTYCLQPGTPGPLAGDAYLQMPLSGTRKDMVKTILLNSRNRPDIEQRHVQLLLWNVVSKADFNKLPAAVRSDAGELLTPKQIFELKGGVMKAVQNASFVLPPELVKTTNTIRGLFDAGISSYEAYERIAVLQQSKTEKNTAVNGQWYRQNGNYFIRHVPSSYQKVKIQIYMPDNVLDTAGKFMGQYVIFDPTGLQVVPATKNIQRLGIGGPVVDIIRKIIKVNTNTQPPIKTPKPQTGDPKISKT